MTPHPAFNRGSSQRRTRQWIETHDEAVINSGFVNIISDLTADYEAALGRTQAGATVMTIRGFVAAEAAATPPTAPDIISFGICFIPENLASGAAGLPDPRTENYDWIWHQHAPSVQGLAQGDYLWGKGTEPIWFHNKSMRKQRETFSKLVLIARHDNGQSVNVQTGLRALWALP